MKDILSQLLRVNSRLEPYLFDKEVQNVVNKLYCNFSISWQSNSDQNVIPVYAAINGNHFK
jgi:transcription elongation factor GreA-like protein